MKTSQPSDSPTASSRVRLLEAAKRLFAAHGYEQSATSAIARQAGTSESQLMRYFGGKVGLLDAIFEEGWKHLNDRVVRAVSTAANAREALLDSINVVVAGLSRDADLATLFMYESRRVRGDDRRTSRGFSRFSENIRGLVRQAQAVRQIDPTLDTNAVTAAVLGATEAMIRERLVAKSGASRGFAEREIRRTLTAILDGFGAPAPPKTVAKRRR